MKVPPSAAAVTSRGHKSSLRWPRFVFQTFSHFLLILSKTRLRKKNNKKKEVKSVLTG